jgi:cyanophycinase
MQPDGFTLNFSGTGTLALTGSGEYLPSMEPVDRYLLSRLSEPARVVCLPTAAGTEGPERVGYWSNLGVEHFKRLGVASVDPLEIIDRPGAEDPQNAARIRAANFVYLSGGKPHYLHQTLQGTPAWSAICEVLERGGVVAGCSAGAMIFGERLLAGLSRWFHADGFGFLQGACIIPHFDEFPPALVGSISLLTNGWTMVGIDGFTALVCSSEGVLVRGKGGVTVCSHGGSRRYLQED